MSDVEVIRNSSLFDESWYNIQYPDVKEIGISPAEHYLLYGARLGRDPGPGFSTTKYLASYLDARRTGVNPLVHFERYGRAEGRAEFGRIQGAEGVQRQDINKVDVVVPVYNARDDVRACLESLARCASSNRIRVIVINDGSDLETASWLRGAIPALGNEAVSFELHEHETNRGYTKAVNTGLRASTAPHVVTLNSDTVVTSGWIEGLLRCMGSDPTIGVVGPLSNAASWQNVPELYGPDGNFAINALPNGCTPDDMARIVSNSGKPIYPRSTFVNGFCFMVRRAVIDAIGIMDEKTFPIGYGEENDFCIRAQDAGFLLAYADDTYVFHAKSKSFGTERRVELSKQGSQALRDKHTPEKVAMLISKVKDTSQMDVVRTRIRQALDNHKQSTAGGTARLAFPQKILFLLPVSGGSGGAHSVVQEVSEMRNLGVEARIAVPAHVLPNFYKIYGDVPNHIDLFVPFDDDSIISVSAEFDVVVATVNNSVSVLKRIIAACPWVLPAYYAQDYEPLFYEQGSARWQTAHDSYTLIAGMVIFAKTDWIRETIHHHHGVNVYKVSPSIDTSIYYPTGDVRRSETLSIAAMIRPQTPRRGAARTMELLKRIIRSYGSKVSVTIFGCEDDHPDFQAMVRDFPFRNMGILNRPDVARLLRESDVFIDLSDYQAFGRTALEAMACGALAMVPKVGGCYEYANGQNALIVDTLNIDECYAELKSVIDDRAKLDGCRLAGLATATEFSIRRAAVSELILLGTKLADHREQTARPHPSRLHLVCSLTKEVNGERSIAGSGYVRLVCPYRQDALQARWHSEISMSGKLPDPKAADVVIVQRDLISEQLLRFPSWAGELRKAGGTLIYEIDDDLMDVDGLYRRGFQGDAAELISRVRMYAAAADLITVSTPAIADAFREHGQKIRIVPNYIDDVIWRITSPRRPSNPEFAKADGVIRIGYVGTPTHHDDMAIVADAIRRIESRYGKAVEVEVIGAFQKGDALFGRRIGLPRLNDYPSFVGWLHKRVNWDIAIIPLADSRFNRAKSNLKFLECAALDVAIISSKTDEYTKVARHEQNALVVANTTDEWEKALKRLIEDATLRKKLASASRRDVASHYTIQANAALYLDVIEHARNLCHVRDAA